jgi:hypothetical protein
VLEGDVEIREDLALRHQRDDVVDMRVGVDVVEAGPHVHLAQLFGQRLELCRHIAAPEL